MSEVGLVSLVLHRNQAIIVAADAARAQSVPEVLALVKRHVEGVRAKFNCRIVFIPENNLGECVNANHSTAAQPL